MRFRKRYVVALLGTAVLLFCVIKYVTEWRRDYASPAQSLDRAREALAKQDVEGAVHLLGEAVERACQDPEELSSVIFQELAILDGAPPLPLPEAAQLYRYRIRLQRRNCETQTWEKVLVRSIKALRWSEGEASAHFHMRHPGRELLEMCVARGEVLGTFAAWRQGRQTGQELKDSGAVPEWAHVLRALANLKAREMDAMGLAHIPAAPIMGWLRKALASRPEDAMLHRALTIGLAIAREDEVLAEHPLPRKSTLREAIALSDAFVEAYADSVPGRINAIETRVRAAELVAMAAKPSAQELLDQFAATCPAKANWREVLRASRLQVRALRFHDPGAPEYAQGIANVRRLTGALLERVPGAPDALVVLGRMCRQIRQDETAREYFRQAAESTVLCSPSVRTLTWDLAAGLAGLALVDMDLQELESAGAASPTALNALGARVDLIAARLGDEVGETLLARGRLALLAGRDREAIVRLEAACRHVGRARPVAFLLSGMALAKAGETGVAATRLEQLVHLERVPPAFRLRADRELARLALCNSPPDQAALRISELTAHHPGDRQLRLTRARALLHSSLQRSVDHNVRSLRLAALLDVLQDLVSRRDEGAILLAAQSEALLGAGPESLRVLERFCREHPQSAEGILAWCRALRLRGEATGEENAVRALVLPHAPPAVAALLEQALLRKSAVRGMLYPLIRLAFVRAPVEQQLGLFWVHWGLGDEKACAAALAAVSSQAPGTTASVAARLAFLLDSGKAQEARALLDSPPVQAMPAWQHDLWQGKLLLAVRELTAADKLLGGLLKRHPQLSEAWALHGLVALRGEQIGAATRRFQHALEINPRQPLALEGLADICFAGNEAVQALGYVRRLVRVVSPSHPRLEATFMAQLTRFGTIGGAVAIRERLQQQAPWDWGNRRELALLYLRSHRVGPAVDILEQLAAEIPGDLGTSLLLARALAGQGRHAEAREILIQASTDTVAVGADPSCLKAAEFLAELGAADEALRLLEQVAASDGRMAPVAGVRLGNLLYRQGAWELAAASYAKHDQAESRPDLVRRRAECLIRAGALPEAQSLLGELEKLVPDDPLVHVLRADLALASNDLVSARRACADALKSDPGCATAFLVRARLLLRSGGGASDLDRAIADLQKACIRDPKLLDARELLIRLLLERGRTDEAAAALGMLVEARPEDRALKLTLSRLLLELGHRASLTSLFKRWRRAAPEEPLWWQVQAMLAVQQGRFRDAASASERHFAETGAPASLLAAVDAYLAAKLPEDAERLCQTAEKASSPAPEALVAIARVRLQGKPAEARALLAKALARTRGEARCAALLGHARKILPRSDLVAWLEEAHARRPSPSVALLLAEVWEESGQRAKVVALLQKLAAEASGRRRGELLARLAAVEYAGGRAVEAERVLRQALAIQPDHPALLNNAAHLALLADGREAEAVRLARRAVAASTDDRDLHACALGTLGEALFRLRLYDQAREALRKALAIHDTAEDRLLLGQALLGSGRAQQGAAQLRKAKEMAVKEGNEELARRIASLL